MTLIEAAVLGLVQGVTEFLPVSSSGHLVMVEGLLKVHSDDATFEVIVHFGTLLAVVTALRGRIADLVVGCFRGEASAWRTVIFLGIGTVPAGLVGVLFEKPLEAAFSSPAAASLWLLFTGVVVWSTRFTRGEHTSVGLWDSILVGLAQAVAVLPGVSRSGMTISTGMWRKVDAREAATFSFLLSIPIILGATALKVGQIAAHPPGMDALLPLLVGAVVAYVSGVAAIRWLLAILRGWKLDLFGYYCWAVGLVGLAFFRG